MESLESLREKIDKIDADIIKKLAMRQTISKKIGHLKSASRKTIRDPAREQAQKKHYEKLCVLYELDFTLVNFLFSKIITHSRNLQKNEL